MRRSTLIACSFPIEAQASHAVKALLNAGIPAAMVGPWTPTHAGRDGQRDAARRIAIGAAAGLSFGMPVGPAVAVGAMVAGACAGAASVMLRRWSAGEPTVAQSEAWGEAPVLVAANPSDSADEALALGKLRELGALEVRVLSSS